MISEQKTETTRLNNPKQNTGAIIFGLQLMLLLAAIDQTIISTAMPKIVTNLGGFDRYAWATSAYLLTSTISIPVFGRLSDIYGRKQLLIAGVLLFIVASTLCGCAGEAVLGSVFDPMNQFIVARAFQGLGAGIVLGLCFSVVGDLFPAAERGKYQGHFAAVFALASVVGPTLGGYISDHHSWRWLFFMNIPIGLIAVLVFNHAFPSDKKSGPQNSLDYPGILLFIGSFVPLLLGLSWTGTSGWLSLPVLGAMLTAAGMTTRFVMRELKSANPFMDVRLFTNRVVTISCLSVFVTGIGMFGSVMLLPIFFQSVVGMSAAKSGTLLTPLIVVVAVTSIIGGYWMSKSKKYKAIIFSGLSCMTIGTFLLARIDSTSSITYMLTNMLLVGAGLGLLLPIYTVVIQNAVEEKDIGAVTGFSQFFRSVGGTTGVAVFGTLMLALYEDGLKLSSDSVTSLAPAAQSLLHNPLETVKLQHGLELLNVSAQEIDSIMQAVKGALVHSIDTIFFLYGLLLTATLIATLFLAELPLREKPNSAA
ncbi:MAG: MFS transporter [Cyanobacteria bacterium SZAS-4]|nr:MFS transporter [Cyanobacteria bacterium SZAS-4]